MFSKVFGMVFYGFWIAFWLAFWETLIFSGVLKQRKKKRSKGKTGEVEHGMWVKENLGDHTFSSFFLNRVSFLFFGYPFLTQLHVSLSMFCYVPQKHVSSTQTSFQVQYDALLCSSAVCLLPTTDRGPRWALASSSKPLS